MLSVVRNRLLLLWICIILFAIYLNIDVNIHTHHTPINIGIIEKEIVSHPPVIPVAFVITSCARWDVLSKEIDSFERSNTYPYIAQRLVIDDCLDFDGLENISSKYPKYKFFRSSTPRTPKYAYPATRSIFSINEITTKINKHIEYVLYSEDDWEFYAPGFIEDSLVILKQNENVFMTFLRNIQFHKPLIDPHQYCGGWHPERCHGMKPKHLYGGYHNRTIEFCVYQYYSNNPGLKRKSYWNKAWSILSKKYIEKNETIDEGKLIQVMKSLNFSMGIILNNSEGKYNGYVGHMGMNKRIIQNISKKVGIIYHPKDVAENNNFVFVDDKWAINKTSCMYIKRETLNSINDTKNNTFNTT